MSSDQVFFPFVDSPFTFACKTVTSRGCLVPAWSFWSHSGFSCDSDGQVGRFSSSPALGSCQVPWPVGSAQKRDPESQGELLLMPRMTLFRWPCVSQAAEADRSLSISRSPNGLGGRAGRRAGCPTLTLHGQGSLCRRHVCVCVCVCVSCSVVFDSLQPRALWLARLLCPWDSPGKNTGGGCQFLLQGSAPM